jgi:hydroxyethylthiazole kinase-like uncharacterized protein yjeF
MKVLTAAEMREVDRRTEELGISGSVLMENAAQCVVDFLADRFSPLSEQRIVVFCGKGNNGGDGLAIARQLRTGFAPAALHVITTEGGESITPEMQDATLVIDAVLGTRIKDAARGKSLEFIEAINSGFPLANVIAVDLPSGMNSDSGFSAGEVARADFCVTFTAPKVCHAMPPNCDAVGELIVADIGSPANLYENVKLHMMEPGDFADLLQPRKPESNKGNYGHVLVVGGAHGKTGASEMAGLAAMRIGAGLVTVASSAQTMHTLELMTDALPQSYDALVKTAERKTVLAIGPGLGSEPQMIDLVRRAASELPLPLVIDADGLNAIAGHEWRAGKNPRILTPHPGEMSRLCGASIKEVQSDRLGTAQRFAAAHNAMLVLKGHRTVIASPDGRAWINPVDTPALAKGGTGDILTGLIAGMLAQFLDDPLASVLAAVYLHGFSGRLVAEAMTDRCLLATDLLTFLPEAIRACAAGSN